MRRVFLCHAVLLIGLASAATLHSQARVPFKPGKLPKDEVAALQPGLALRFNRGAQTAVALDVRRVRLAALHVPAGEPATPFMLPGPFVARFTAYVKSPLRNEYAFRVASSGDVALSVNGRAVALGKDGSEPVELAKGYNRLEVLYTSPQQGDATLRIYWSGEGFDWEPIPPDALFTRGDDVDLIAHNRLREGRHLFATLGCARCHALPDAVKRGAMAMPEMQQQAPSLVDAGQRFRLEWLARWIAEPRSLRAEATMPRLLDEAQAADVAVYLATLRNRTAAGARSGAADQGQKHFRKLGCLACHHLEAPNHEDELKRLSLAGVAAKFQPGALQAFLLEPQRHYPWTRMPDFKLSAREASEIAGYLEREATLTLPASPHLSEASALRGARLFQDSGCAHCHRVDTKTELLLPHLPAIGSRLHSGCLSSRDRGKAPDFGLSDGKRQALTAFLQADVASLTRETAAEFSLRQAQALQCQSCHRRDGGTTRWHLVLEEEGLMPETIPALTWAGEKLQHEWAVRLLNGKVDQRARPWLKARMPAFPARAEMLARGLAHEHGFDTRPEPPLKIDPQLAAIGARLLPQQGGFNCIMCHGVGTKRALEPFEAPGINLVDAALRLRTEYYRRWMLNPTRVDVVTRMPVFAQDGKTTQLRGVFAGDARRQNEAIWHYMQTLK